MKDIIFTPIFPVNDEFYPIPASKNIPEWYKNTNSFINSNNFEANDGKGNQTIKKCMPVFDSLTSGYILKTHVDIYVSKTENEFSYYNWPAYSPIQFHAIEQAAVYPTKKDNMPYPKFINPWSIQTTKGYSTLFIPPMHNPNIFFTILPGVVDTDQFLIPVNFPFILNDPNFEGMIPAGTDICQVIPFKRDSFKMKIGDSTIKEKIKLFEFLYNNKFVNNYKNKFWNKKEYR